MLMDTNDVIIYSYNGESTSEICRIEESFLKWDFDSLKSFIIGYENITLEDFHSRFTKSQVSVCWFDHSMPVYNDKGKLISQAKMNVSYYIQKYV